jgi:F-type H+-transporting ATPase subunit alpha
MAVSLFAVDRGFMDDVELDKVGDFEDALQSYMGSSHADFMQSIEDNPVFNDEVESKLAAAVDDFKANNTW